MKRILFVAVAVALLAPYGSSHGSELQKELKARWLGAWVVTRVEAYSDCRGSYTNNRIHGNLVKGSGVYPFQAGELAKVDKVDVKRSRFDVLLSLVEPVLLPYQEGPFTLYREASCRIELEVAVPREVVKSRAVDFIDESVLRVVERYATEREARLSGSWNEREQDPYPEDYEQTLAELAAWRAEQSNLAVQAKIDSAMEETTQLVYRVGRDPLYLAGFSEGVEDARGNVPQGCPALMTVRLGRTRQRNETEAEARHREGYEDGRTLVYALELMHKLPGCFVPVPEVPEIRVAARE